MKWDTDYAVMGEETAGAKERKRYDKQMGEAAQIEIELIRLKEVVQIIHSTLTVEGPASSDEEQGSYPSGWDDVLTIEGLSSDESSNKVEIMEKGKEGTSTKTRTNRTNTAARSGHADGGKALMTRQQRAGKGSDSSMTG